MPPKIRPTCHAIVCALIACLTALPCEAAGGLIRQTDTGQPRELINQPICWSTEKVDGWRTCELSEQ